MSTESTPEPDSPNPADSLLPASGGNGGAEPTSGRNRVVLMILAGLVVVALAIGSFFLLTRNSPQADPTPAASSTPTATSTAATGGGMAPAGKCEPWKGEFVPTKLAIKDLGVSSPIMSLGRDADAAAAPPKNQSHSTGWFNESPKPGSDHGKVLLTIHTYRDGGALGNELLKIWKPGHTLVLSDDKGNSACYVTGERLKFNVSDYDPNSKLVYDSDTPKPQVAIVVCDDFNRSKDDWDARVVFYADREDPTNPTPKKP